MPAITEGLNLGDLLKYEAPNLFSRDQVTVASGQTLPLGAVVGIVTATGKVKQIDPSATDGSQYAAGVLMQPCDAALIDREEPVAEPWDEPREGTAPAPAHVRLRARSGPSAPTVTAKKPRRRSGKC